MRRVRIPLIFVLAMLAIPSPAVAQLASAAVTAPQAVTAEIREQARGKLKSFYAARAFAPLWTQAGRIGPEADALLAWLATSDIDGLKPKSFKLDKLHETLAAARSGDPRDLARAELKLSDAFARYARDMRRPPKLDMTFLDPRLKPKKPDIQAVLRAAALPPSLAHYITSMAWMSPHYVQQRGLAARARASGDPEIIARSRINLDRARVLPGPFTHHIVVDAASGHLWFYQAGKQAGTMRVVVGRPETPTPMLAGMLQYAILNPYWNIPVGLVQTLVAPRILAGKSMRSLGYEALSDWSADPRPVDPATINWPSIAAGEQELRVRQRPGPSNSMGRVKFMFPNDDGIYLHDSPDRALFAASDRHFSNGCIRLEDAATLGKWLLGRSIRTAARTPEQAVPLTAPVPIYLTYFTAQDGPAGIQFRADIYNRDGKPTLPSPFKGEATRP
ncbi:hypothetical protein GCM10011529_15830 [Polymorphobacter glacialis]|uniref:L,D-TPase catalytic domain-containing protein n=1 Tax=Sandarakinorhabdus glacialis TaxID=1614636 RepID=A0A917E6X3_9SPHN|nr:L,D-transpeptidase family protein [Polymorphobacter glacialis]GGE10290.1 hypothetical protein GCM10011529_15830 [Polymorphobacter glacialis]